MKGCVSAADAVDSKVPSRLQLQPSTDCRHAGAIRSRCVSVDRDVVLPREVRRGHEKMWAVWTHTGTLRIVPAKAANVQAKADFKRSMRAQELQCGGGTRVRVQASK